MEKLTDRLAAIRQEARVIVNNSRTVSVDYAALNHMVITMQTWPVQASVNPIVASTMLTNEQKISLTLFFGVVNYCFVDPQRGLDYAYTAEGRQYTRSTACTQAMIESDLPWDKPAEIAHISQDIWRKLLHLNEMGVVLFDDVERVNRLQRFGIYLHEAVGTFNDFFKRYPNAHSIYELLMPSGLFDDKFLKRFQIVITWLDDIARTTDAQFDGIPDLLTVMADYRLPQVLMQEGVLTIAKEVNNQLMSQLVDVEVEQTLRAATIIACESIAITRGISTTQLDRVLWQHSHVLIENGQMTTPAMRVATRAY